MDPTGPAQPNLDAVYQTSSNPTTKTPAEQHTSETRTPNTSITETRQPGDIPIPRTQTSSSDSGTPSALGRGSTNDLPDKGEDAGRPADELEGEQMSMLAEGRVYDAQLQKGKVGGFGEEKSLTSDLERKKEEQRGMREEVMAQRKEEVDVGGALGQRGGVATVEGR
ncbi:hypothetical protein MMC16_001229 [Acarospora aff. strigata]|nr:hypothetical protein [Acarospora aff. strigata]